MIWSVSQIELKWFPYPYILLRSFSILVNSGYRNIKRVANTQHLFTSISKNNFNVKRKISVKQENVCSTRLQSSGHVHVFEKNTGNLLLSTKNTSTWSRFRLPLKDPRSLCWSLFRAAKLNAFLLKQKRWSRGRFNSIFNVACKRPVCVEVLTSFCGIFVVEVWQFKNNKFLNIVPPFGPPFFPLLTPPRFEGVFRESKSYRKPFSHGPHTF